MNQVQCKVYDLADVVADEGLLSVDEKINLKSLGLVKKRRDEWIKGRLAARRAMVEMPGAQFKGIGTLTGHNGAPYLTNDVNWAVSLSHDGNYLAVALCSGRETPIGVDICLRSHEKKLPAILKRLAIKGGGVDPVVQWVALECSAKIQYEGITAFFNSSITIKRKNDVIFVNGMGELKKIYFKCTGDYAVAWGKGESTCI